MANRKISDLTALTAPVAGDLLPIVDISEAAAADKNKKITYGVFLSSVPLGTAGAPSIAFTGDNTGIYSPGADQLAIATGGTARITVDGSGNVGIGTTSPAGALDVNGEVFARGGVGVFNGTTLGGSLVASAAGRLKIRSYNATGADGGETIFVRNNTSVELESARLDASGRLLVGASSDSGGALFQVNGDRIRVGTAKTPASASATGTAGEICWDASYIYVCTATNTWKRTAIATW